LYSIKPGGNGSAIGYHQDSWYISNQFTPREQNSVTCWIPLDNVDNPQIGTIEYARGSHLLQDTGTGKNHNLAQGFHDNNSSLDHRNAFFEKHSLGNVEFVKALTGFGSVVFHHQDTWHGSGPNVSNGPRRAVVAHLIDGDVRFANHTKEELPWKASYIYGRYRMLESDELNEQFFPIIYPLEKRSKFLSGYCNDALNTSE
jgi:phytanoyl-CoA hydroxylase